MTNTERFPEIIPPGRKSAIAADAELVKVEDLKLGDIVRVIDTYGDCTVVKLETVEIKYQGRVINSYIAAHVFRPYVIVSDFSTGGHNITAVMHSIGFEQFTLSGSAPVERIRRGPQLR